MKADRDVQENHGGSRRAWALSCRVAVALGVGGALLLLLGGGVLALAHDHVTLDPTRSPSAALGLAVGTVGAVLLVASVALTTTVSAIALLVRDHLEGRHPHLGRTLATAVATTPGALLVGLAAAAVTGLLVVLAPVVVIAALAATGWRLARRTAPRRSVLTGLLWALPFAAALRAAAAAPAVYASLLNRAPLRAAVRAVRGQRLRARAVVLAGLIVIAAVNVVLTELTLTGLQARPAFYAVLGGTLLLAGTGAGVLAATPARGDGASGVAPRQQRDRRGPWRRPLRRARVAAVTAVAIVAGTVGIASPALAVPAAVAGDIVVDVASDPSTAADPGQCQDVAPCGIRAALALAAQQAATGGSATVTFDGSLDGGTITLAGTLQIAAGVTVDAGTSTVTLDAHHGFRALQTVLAGGDEGPRVTLRGLHVTGGRSASGGAGLHSDAVRVVLDQVTFSDNVASGGDGGAVAVPHTQLTVTGSTFTDNHAGGGAGGAMTAAGLTLTNSTLVDNTGSAGTTEGGAVYAPSGGHVSHVTVSGSGGLAGSDAGHLQVSNTLVTEPAGPWFACARITAPDDAAAPSVGNVDSAGTCAGTKADPQPLGALAANGGRTRTMIPAPGNPAIGAGSADWCAASDQRGQARDRHSCDAGAVQTNGDVPPVDLYLSPVSTFPAGTPMTFNAIVRQPLDNSVPAGSLQMVEGATPLGDPVQIDTDVSSYQLTVPALAQGPHTVALRFTPPGGGTPQDSAPAHLGVVVAARVAVATSAPVTVNDPATLVATISDDLENGSGRDAGAPEPTGTATFRFNGGEAADAPVTDGVATLHVDSLTAPAVTVIYSGDDWYGFSLADQPDVFDADVPTRTTATVETPEVAYGQQTRIGVRVADARGAAPAGAAHLVVDGVGSDVEALDGGTATLTAGLGIGTHTGYVDYEPRTGWTGSRSAAFSVTVTPARSSIALGHDAAHPAAYPQQPYLTFTADGEPGAATVLLKDGGTVLAQQQVVLPTSGSFSLPAGTFDVGTRTVHAEIASTATMAAATSAEVPVTVVPGASGVTLAPDHGARVGEPVTVRVHTDGSLPATLTVTLDDGRQVAQQRLLTSADTTFAYTPTAASTRLTATVTFDGGRYAQAVGAATVTADPTSGPAPELRWESTGTDFTTSPLQLHVRYPTTPGLAAPTGSVTLFDGNGAWVGSGPVTDGVATVALWATPGTCYCDSTAVTVTYSGDDVYRARGDMAPDVTAPGRATTTALVVRTLDVRPGQAVDMTVRVTAAGSGTPVGEVSVALDGNVFTSGTLSDGSAEVSGWIPAGLTGPVTLTARFTPATATWNTSQVTVDAVVIPYAPPTVTLTVGAFEHRIGQAEQLQAVATVSDPSAPLDTGAPLSVRDDTGALLGTGSWLSNGTAILTITPVHGGARTLTATYTYGGGKQTTSVPLPMTVRGVTAPLTVTAAGPAAVGRHVGVRVTLGTLPAGITPGALTVRLYDGGREVAGAAPLVPDAAGTLSALLSVVPSRKGGLTLVARTDGDGGDIGTSTGTVGLTVAPGTLTLRPPAGTLAPVVLGKRLTTPDVPITGSVGVPADGELTTTLVDSSGSSTPGCRTTLPETRCEVPTGSLTPGTYTLAYRFSGSAVYDDVPRVPGARFVLQPATTAIGTRFSSAPHQWVAGEEVTATFAVTDAFDDDGRASGMIRLRTASYGELCLSAVSRARTARCTFTVPWPDAPPVDPLGETVTTTFTPASRYSAGSETGAWLRGIPRCYTATSDRSYAVTFDSGVPAVAVESGRVCSTASPGGDRAGTLPGYTEGSVLTVTADLARTGHGWQFTGMTATPAGSTGYLLGTGDGRGRVGTAPLTANTRFAPAFTWAPRCVEVAAGYEDLEGHGRSRADYARYASWRTDAVARPANSVQLETPSNCASPFGAMSDAERADFAQGIGHYVVGTDVRVYPVNGSGYPVTLARPDWQLKSVPGATEDALGFWHLTASAPTVAYGVFRWSPAMCRSVTTSAGAGGTVAVTGSSFPAALAPMEDPTGACVTTYGERGYLVGTTVTAIATPANALTARGQRPAVGENYLYRWPADWRDQHDGRQVLATSEVPGRSGGIDGDPYAAHIATGVVPLSSGLSFAATFARVGCVPVTLDLTGLSVGAMNLTPGNCPAVPTDQQVGSRNVRYYTGGTHVEFDPVAPTKPGPDGTTVGLRWKADITGTDGTQTLTFDDRPNGAFDVRWTTTGAVLTGAYVNTACRELRLAAPRLPGYEVFVVGGDCPRGQTDGTQTQATTSIPAAARANGVLPQWKILSRNVEDVLTGLDDPASSSRDTYPLVSHADTIIYNGQLSVDLMYCRPVADLVTVSLVDAVGRPLPAWGAPDPARTLQSYNDRCVGNDMPVEASPQLDLTDDAKRTWTVVGWKNDRTGQLSLTDLSPRFRVDSDGVTADRWTLLVQPRCYRLHAGARVDVDTAPNCAGQDPANGLYTADTVVNLSFAGGEGISFGRWDREDSSNGEKATVTMITDRVVYASWSERDVGWVEKAATGLSNAGQRFVAGIVTGINLFVLEPIAAVLAVGPVFNAIADGLSALGLKGAFVDGLRDLGNLMSATSDALNAWGTCTTAWATGSEEVAGVLTPSSATGQGALATGESGAGKLAGRLDTAHGTEAFSSGLKDVETLRDTINLFTSNFSAYTQDPEKAWTGMVDSLNTCFKAKATGVADAAAKLGR